MKNIYEVQAKGFTWWISADDEFEVLPLLRESLFDLELSDEEIDEALQSPRISEISHNEASTIEVVDEYGDSMYSVLDLFLRMSGKGVLTTDFRQDLMDEEDEDELFYPHDFDFGDDY